MKKLALSGLLVIMLFGSALAHNGALSLYILDQTVLICNKDIGFLENAIISLYYIKDLGDDLGKAVEFKLLSSDPSGIFIGETWSTQITATLGDVDNGISLAASTCMGPGEDVVFIGDITVFYSNFTPTTFTVRVVDHPTTQPPGIFITLCDAGNTLQSVLGGTFVFNGSCNPGVQPTSWGAIKELYR